MCNVAVGRTETPTSVGANTTPKGTRDMHTSPFTRSRFFFYSCGKDEKIQIRFLPTRPRLVLRGHRSRILAAALSGKPIRNSLLQRDVERAPKVSSTRAAKSARRAAVTFRDTLHSRQRRSSTCDAQSYYEWHRRALCEKKTNQLFCVFFSFLPALSLCLVRPTCTRSQARRRIGPNWQHRSDLFSSV